jgi:hypothetical protein
MIKWLKCLFLGHEYGKWIEDCKIYKDNDTNNLFIPKAIKICRKCDATKVIYSIGMKGYNENLKCYTYMQYWCAKMNE